MSDSKHLHKHSELTLALFQAAVRGAEVTIQPDREGSPHCILQVGSKGTHIHHEALANEEGLTRLIKKLLSEQ
jgi:hypothetical protein